MSYAGRTCEAARALIVAPVRLTWLDVMSMVRCFLAVDVTAGVQRAIQSTTLALHQRVGPNIVKWVPVQNIHLTLNFLGDAAPTSLAHFESLLDAAVTRFAAFDAHVQGLGAFPSLKRARVLWIGVTAPATLSALQHELDTATRRLGYATEERGFSPHLTIGRVAQNASQSDLQRIREAIELTEVGRLGSFRIDVVKLYKSQLTQSGAIYTQICSVRLAGNDARHPETHPADRENVPRGET